MAYIIEHEEVIRFNCGIRDRDKCRFNQTFPRQIKNNFIFIREGLAKGVGKLDNFNLILEENDRKIVLRYIANKLYKNLALLFTISVDAASDEVSIKTKLLSLQGRFGKVQGPERRKLVTKYLCSRGAAGQGGYRIALNVETGELKFQSPAYRFCLAGGCVTLGALLQQLSQQFALHLRAFQELLLNVLFLADGQFGSLHLELQDRLKDRKIVQATRFLQFMNVFLNLASEAANEELDLNLSLRKEADSFQRFKQSRVAVGSELGSISLFCEPREELGQREQLQLSFLERAYINERLQLPLSQKSSIPNENFFVLNYIKVNKKLSETMIKKIKVGGFTTIYLSEIEYWYVGSYCVGVLQESFEGTPPLKKYIIIKREDKRSAQLNGKSRVAHERLILTKIKFGLSMFLPKYYLLAEKDNSYENDLLVDYIGSPNLSEYIERNQLSLSFNTKIYFVMMIAQALRYLKEYRIAHLDLKPSNIMTHRRLILKLIDFGESYHPELQKTHQPGFSMPYSAPENYNFRDSYDSKNDVFSLGVIMYELFLGKYPFYLHDEDLRHRVYSEGTYLEYWLESPEEALACGDPVLMPIIYSIMAKCLSPDPGDRPELEWIVLLFREFIESVK